MRKVEIKKPKYFFKGLNWGHVKKVFMQQPIKSIAALIIYYVIALVMFVRYYVTIIPRIIYEQFKRCEKPEEGE